MEDLKPIIAHNIQSLRQGAGMTQLELADALHYSDKAVSKWERGESLPDILILKKIADLFQVTVDRLLRPDAAPLRQKDLHSRKIITAISLTGVAALAIIAHIIFPTWLVFLYALPAGATLGEFDLKAEDYTLVLNEQDGFYHLNAADGPLVLMRLGQKSEYLDSFKTILERSGVVKYFFDEEETE